MTVRISQNGSYFVGIDPNNHPALYWMPWECGLDFANFFRLNIYLLEFCEFSQGSLRILIRFLNNLLDMFGIGFRVVYYLVVYFLVATFAQAAGVMCSIFVLAFSCLLLVALVKVAEVAHEFGFVPTVVVIANGHAFQRTQYLHKERFCLLLARSYQFALLVAVLSDVLLPLGDDSL